MKRCPECRRDYFDDSLQFCLEDGVALIQGSVPSADDHRTAILYNTGEEQTRTFDPPVTTAIASKRNSVIVGAIAIVLMTALGVGGYWIYGRGSSKRIESIAVMPFANESGDADVEYLSDGMTETLISSLSRMPALNVKPRSMVFRYKGKDIDFQSLGKELSVNSILTGRVVARGADLSLFVELIDVASTKVIWSRQYNRKQSEIVSLQSEVARDVSGEINSGLSAADEVKVTKSSTENPEAYRLYLLANSLTARRKVKDLRTALDYYQQAIALDPNYALAYVGVASSHAYMTIYCGQPSSVELPLARTAAMRALEIDPGSAEAHNILGGIELYLNGDFAANERENDIALKLNPNFANPYRHIGLRKCWFGRFDEALASFRRGQELDPMSMPLNTHLAGCLFYAGRIAESDEVLRKAGEIDPNFWPYELQLFINARGKHEYDAAADHLARAQELRDEPGAAKFIREAYSTGGWTGLMRDAIANPERSKIWDYYLASFALELGDKDRAFNLLSGANDELDQFTFNLKIDPAFSPVRDDPRYVALLKKLNLPD